jgi:dihydrofolate reductase
LNWTNSTLVKGDVAAEIRALKELPGKDIAMSGSAILAEWLLHQNLLDELRVMVHPIVLGSGRRLFKDGQSQQSLELVQSKTYRSGVVDLTYRPAAS